MITHIRNLSVALLLCGCGSAPPEPTDSDTDTDTPPSGSWRDNLPTPPPYSCPPTDVEITQQLVPGASGYHGLAFDSEGRMVGSDGDSLIRSTSDGQGQLWIPNIGLVDQLTFLADGDLIAARAEAPGLIRITPEGGLSALAEGVIFYGVQAGPDGLIYAAGPEGVFRVDPSTDATEVLIPGSSTFSPHTVAFTPDYSQLIVGVTWPIDAVDSSTDPLLSDRQAACHGSNDGDSCEFSTNAHTTVGECVTLEGHAECWDFDFGPHGDFPASAQQFNACTGLAVGDPCVFIDSFDEELPGQCYRFDDQEPACWLFGFGAHRGPFDTSPAQAAACAHTPFGESCTYHSASGALREGSCETIVLDTEAEFGCWDFSSFGRGRTTQQQACAGKTSGDPCNYVDPIQGRVSGACEDNSDNHTLACWDETMLEEPALDVLAWDLDEDLTPLGLPQVYAEHLGGYHDALAFDLCGNLWISDFATSNLYRVAPDHSWEVMVDWSLDEVPLSSYGHAILWGTGLNGWSADSIYVALPYASDQVKELKVGVPGAQWTGQGL